jgi:hypothetical protein
MATERTFGQRLRRLLLLLFVLGLLGAATYVLAWFNHRTFHLEVGPASARVERGRMLPFGREPYMASDPMLRRVYRPFPLPAGWIDAPRSRSFTDRRELNRALRELLRDASEHVIETDERRGPELLDVYLDRLRRLPDPAPDAKVEIARLERDAAYVRAKHAMLEAEGALQTAVEEFSKAAEATGSRFGDGAQRARRARAALQALEGALATPTPAPETPKPESTAPESAAEQAGVNGPTTTGTHSAPND